MRLRAWRSASAAEEGERYVCDDAPANLNSPGPSLLWASEAVVADEDTSVVVCIVQLHSLS